MRCPGTIRSCSAPWPRLDAIKAAIAAGKRICVHGDYDADGICATALAVPILRELGADVDWHLPSRFEEGYGVSARRSPGSPTRAAGSCSPSTAASPPSRRSPRRARAGSRSWSPTTTGPASRSRTAPSSPPAVDYPFPELCGTGVVYKLGEALLGPARALTRHLDLVALATISDVVPLVDENRALARAGLRALARTQKPGLRALMRSPARSRPGRRGGGRLPARAADQRRRPPGRPGAALELLLTEDKDEAGRSRSSWRS